jgi:hypothetical protein
MMDGLWSALESNQAEVAKRPIELSAWSTEIDQPAKNLAFK